MQIVELSSVEAFFHFLWKSGAHNPKSVTPILSLSNGVFTDQVIFAAFLPEKKKWMLSKHQKDFLLVSGFNG